MRAYIIALTWFLSCAFPLTQLSATSPAPGMFEDLVLSKEIPDFSMIQGTLFDGLKGLSSGPIPFALGFEEVLREKFADPAPPNPHFNLELRNRTVREILNALCLADPRYTWSVQGATINVYPRATVDDTSYLLNRRLIKFELNGITDIDQGLLAIVRQLPPPEEQVAHVQMGGDSSYPPDPWKVSFQNLAVRQAINHLVAHMGPNACWIFHGSRDFRTFTFLRSGFHKEAELRHEGQ